MDPREIVRVRNYPGRRFLVVRRGDKETRVREVDKKQSFLVPTDHVEPTGLYHNPSRDVTKAGLHILKNICDEQSDLLGFCQSIETNVDLILQNTMEQSPSRRSRHSFELLKRHVEQCPAGKGERALECRLFQTYRHDRAALESSRNLWKHLASWQVPLFDNAAKDEWGWIDLIGWDHAGLPVIVELKDFQSNDSPVKMLLQATGYAVALKKVWANMFAEAKADLAQLVAAGFPDAFPAAHIVGVAPIQYWQQRPNWLHGESSEATALRLIAQVLRSRGYSVSLASIEETEIGLAINLVGQI